ncbi:hypothetical protein KS4_10950 [Poriferisphaera corsica]|uniref:Uncharacterized protein n=1 Tax=Poriferisphaera corsica TaxID=2528020 RepID=A0A517YS57_9BACT|nr:hypothetical protein [Poriferisphaera corsica]QDU33054.1 hypothetical protein KS4_10950 [Poriferisphaera corsica]
MSYEPTDKQLAYLKRLKYQGPNPKSKGEASALIEDSKTKMAKAKEAGREFKGLTVKQAERVINKVHRDWLKERRKEIREQIKDDLGVQRDFEKDMRKCGGLDHKDEFAGWILIIGSECNHSKHLNRLLVAVNDAKTDLGLLPPYDTCLEETCECEIEPVTVRDVPKGTFIAERDLENQNHHEDKKKKKSSTGCLTFLMLVLVMIVLFHAAFT